MTLNLAQRSSKVIDFGTNRKHVYIFLLVVNSNLDPVVRYTVDLLTYCDSDLDRQLHILRVWHVEKIKHLLLMKIW